VVEELRIADIAVAADIVVGVRVAAVGVAEQT